MDHFIQDKMIAFKDTHMSSWPPLTTYQEMTLHTRCEPKLAKNIWSPLRLTQPTILADIMRSGATLLGPVIVAAEKLLEGKNPVVHSLTTEEQPLFVFHKGSAVSSYDRDSKSVLKGVGFGIVYDGLSPDHHITLLVKLLDGSHVVINSNGESHHKYISYLDEHGLSYMSIPLQQKVSSVGACGAVTLMLMKHLVSVAPKLTSPMELFRIVTEYSSQYPPNLHTDYKLAVTEIANEFPESYDSKKLYENDSRCRWCVPSTEKLRPTIEV